MIIFQQMLAFLIFIIMGFFARKKEYISQSATKSISWLVADIANPALIISSAMGSTDISLQQILYLFVIACISYAALTVIAILIPHVLRVPVKQAGTYRNMTIFANIGFMGFPLLRALYGAQAVLYTSIFVLIFNLLIYTFGIYNCELANEGSSGKLKLSSKMFLNTGVIACVIGVILCLTKLRLPTFLDVVITNAANMTAALSMINVGTFLARVAPDKMLRDVRLWIFSVIKMIILPIVGVLVMGIFVKDRLLLAVAVIIFGAPVANMVAILADQHSDDSDFATGSVAITTLMAVLTLPLVYSILGL